MATNYATIYTNRSFLFTEFGEGLARKWFGDEAVDALPKYVRGKHKGKPKGVVVWRKVERGGWVKDAYSCRGGYVENRVGQVIERRLHEMAAYDPYGMSMAEWGREILGEGDTLKAKAEKVAEAA